MANSSSQAFRPHFKFRYLLTLSLLVIVSSCTRRPEEKAAQFLDSGRKHLQTKDLERAILDFRNAVQVMPKNAEAYYQLGLAYLESGNAQAAVSEFSQAIALDAHHEAAQLKLAEIMALNQSLDVVKEGQRRAEEVLKSSPDNPDALQTLALAELRLENPTDAVLHLEQALAKVPRHLNSSITLAMIKLREHDATGAEQVLRDAVAEAPQSPEHAVALGYLYLSLHKQDQAEQQFRRALEIDPKNGPALVALGNSLFRAQNIPEAEKLFERVSALPDKQYKPLHAIFLFQIGQKDRAVAEFEKLYKSEPQNREARTRLVAAKLGTGRSADALTILAAALKQNPNDVDALMQRAEVNLAAGNYNDAQADMTTAVRFRPDSAQAHFLMARVYQARGASASQIHELSEALRLDPQLLQARLELAHAFTLSNSPKSALQVLEQTPTGDKSSIKVIVERNVAFYALGDLASVRKGIDEGLAVSRHPSLLMQDGLLRMNQKDFRGSRASLEEVLAQQPQEWRAVQALAQTYAAEKKGEEAIRIIRQYVSREPKSAEGQELLGNWLAGSGDLVGAKAALGNAKLLAPNSSSVDLALAQIAIKEGKLDLARETLAAVANREPRNVSALLSLAAVEELAARPVDAVPYYEKVLGEDAQNIQALNNLAYLLADTGKDSDRALTLAQKAKELAPENPSIDDTIGWAYYNKGLYQASLEYLKRGAKTGTPKRKCHLAMAYIKLGDRRQAMSLVQSALADQPTLPEAKRALDLLAQAR